MNKIVFRCAAVCSAFAAAAETYLPREGDFEVSVWQTTGFLLE